MGASRKSSMMSTSIFATRSRARKSRRLARIRARGTRIGRRATAGEGGPWNASCEASCATRFRFRAAGSSRLTAEWCRHTAEKGAANGGFLLRGVRTTADIATMQLAEMKATAAGLLARAALRVPAIERALVVSCHSNGMRRFGVGAVANSYGRVLKGREFRVADLDGYRLMVNVAEPLGISPYFFGSSGVAWFTEALVDRGDMCVDAGANMGHYTFMLGSRIGPTGRIFAFEANPEFVKVLGQSVRLNEFVDRISIEPKAMWRTSGERKTFFLSVNPSNSGTSSLVAHGVSQSPDSTIEVETISLDDFVNERGIRRLKLLKIDVERAEAEVIAGSRNLLEARRIDYLIVEMLSGSEAHRLLTELGYVGFHADQVARRLVPAEDVGPSLFADYVFVHRDGLREFEARVRPWLAEPL